MNAPTIYRAASKGKPFTRNEKINIVNHGHAAAKRRAAINAAVAEEKNRLKGETTERARAAAIRKAILENPEQKFSAIKRKADGSVALQPRIGGKFGKALTIFHG